MDAPNAPNPTNPNAQDQFVDAVQGPAAQNQAQGLAAQAQGPANNNVQVGQNVPLQPPQQLASAQPVPAGPVMPAPQVVYQNWVGKKPEFSGKPEEDAESRLLSTRNWMEAHNFPQEVKVRQFFIRKLNFSSTESIFTGNTSFHSPPDMASSGVWENVILPKTPTFEGVSGILYFIIFLNSHHAINNKYSIISTLLHRAKNICSNKKLLEEEHTYIQKALTACKYPNWAIKRMKLKLDTKNQAEQQKHPDKEQRSHNCSI